MLRSTFLGRSLITDHQNHDLPIADHRMAGEWESFIYNLAEFAPFVEMKLTMY